jgi:hypothetical protein
LWTGRGEFLLSILCSSLDSPLAGTSSEAESQGATHLLFDGFLNLKIRWVRFPRPKATRQYAPQSARHPCSLQAKDKTSNPAPPTKNGTPMGGKVALNRRSPIATTRAARPSPRLAASLLTCGRIRERSPIAATRVVRPSPSLATSRNTCGCMQGPSRGRTN